MKQQTEDEALTVKDKMRTPLRSVLLAFLLAFFSVLLPHDGFGLRIGLAGDLAPLTRQGLDKAGSGLQPVLDARSESIRKVQAPRPSQKPVWLAGGADAALLPEFPELRLLSLPEDHATSHRAGAQSIETSAYWSRAPPTSLFLV